jgi:hypothetical protein
LCRHVARCDWLQQKLAKNPLDKAVAANLLADSCADIRAVKIFDHDIAVIQALRTVLHAAAQHGTTGTINCTTRCPTQAGFTEITLAVPNVELKEMASSMSLPSQIAASLAPIAATGVRLTIAVGNEPLATWYRSAACRNTARRVATRSNTACASHAVQLLQRSATRCGAASRQVQRRVQRIPRRRADQHARGAHRAAAAGAPHRAVRLRCGQVPRGAPHGPRSVTWHAALQRATCGWRFLLP